MKALLQLLLYILLLGAIGFLSCEKDHEVINTRTNKPPVAHAGPDRMITLPKDSVVLDGKASYDPDGSIAKYHWSKVSGPSSMIIISEDASSTIIHSLIRGTYELELMVTDNDGAYDKDTIRITVNSAGGSNQPPVAHAGADQSITLPTNFCMLNGISSFDPDGNIISYLWSKVSGPSSFTIQTPSSMQPTLYNLVQGTYQFELMITDNGGLNGKDTVQVTVNPASTSTCNLSNRATVTITMTPIGSLSVARWPAAAAAGNKVVFAGGVNSYSAGNYTISDAVDIYDVVDHSWKTAKLSEKRAGITAISSGSKIFFAGGYNGVNESGNVDIYDAGSGEWKLAHLSVPRGSMAAAVVGNKVIFAGGESQGEESKAVDIYDLESQKWSTASLSVARMNLGAVTVGKKVYFAGGENWWGMPYSTIDLFDDANPVTPWSTSSLKQLNGPVSGAVVGERIYWSGLSRNESSSAVEIWNTTDGSVSFDCLTYTRYLQTTLAVNNQVFFSTNNLYYSGDHKNWVDIYNTGTGKWLKGMLNEAVSATGWVVLNNTLYMGGGGSAQQAFSNKVYALSW